jgi:hypothetical protein
VPQQPVEACIALSIVFVAARLFMRARAGRVGQSGGRGLSLSLWPAARIRFAGALNAVGLPQTAIPVALLFFNVGVELATSLHRGDLEYHGPGAMAQ